jgi:hypothetical protein
MSKALATSRKTAPFSLFSPKFLITLNEEGQLHRSAVLGSKPQLLVAQ